MSPTHTHWLSPQHHLNSSFVMGMAVRGVKVALSYLSTQLRPEGLVSPPACAGSGQPCTKLVTHDSEKTSAATIAPHTVYGKTRNLERSPYRSIPSTSVPDASTIFARGQTSFLAIAIKGPLALDNSCKWPKWRYFIDADIQPHYILFL